MYLHQLRFLLPNWGSFLWFESFVAVVFEFPSLPMVLSVVQVAFVYKTITENMSDHLWLLDKLQLAG